MTGRPFAPNELPLSPACVRWWIGEWQKCSASCGGSGQTKRTVLCIQAVSAEEQKALPSRECELMPKPASLSSCNIHIPCPADWTAGNWSKVSMNQHFEPIVSKFRFILFSKFFNAVISQGLEIGSKKEMLRCSVFPLTQVVLLKNKPFALLVGSFRPCSVH